MMTKDQRAAFERYLARLAARKVGTLKVKQPDPNIRSYRDVRVIGLERKEQR